MLTIFPLIHVLGHVTIKDMGGYETGLKLLEQYLADNKRTVVLMGGSASYVEEDLAALGSHPHIVKTLPRQSLTDYAEDLKKIAAANTEQGIMVVEDHSLSNGKMIFIAEHFPDIEVVSIVGQKQISNFPNSRVLVVDPIEAKNYMANAVHLQLTNASDKAYHSI